MPQLDAGKQCPEFGRGDLMTLLGDDTIGPVKRHRIRGTGVQIVVSPELIVRGVVVCNAVLE
jgi:hypothetical protein